MADRSTRLPTPALIGRNRPVRPAPLGRAWHPLRMAANLPRWHIKGGFIRRAILARLGHRKRGRPVQIGSPLPRPLTAASSRRYPITTGFTCPPTLVQLGRSKIQELMPGRPFAARLTGAGWRQPSIWGEFIIRPPRHKPSLLPVPLAALPAPKVRPSNCSTLATISGCP